MASGLKCCKSNSSLEGYEKGCVNCRVTVRNAAICMDPKCNKLVLPREKDKSNLVCQCPDNYWFDLKHSNLFKTSIRDRKCGACGSDCKKIGESSAAFCEKHVQNKPELEDIKYCIVCGNDENVFVAIYPVGVCVSEDCREILKKYKF